jgi:hypothetical protein
MKRFSTDRVQEILRRLGRQPSATSEGLELCSPGGCASITAELVDAPTYDGLRVKEVARVRHPVPALKGKVNAEFVRCWNRYSSFATLHLDGSGSEVPTLWSKFPILEDDVGAAEILYPQLAAAATHMSGAAAYFLRPGSPCAEDFFAGRPVPGPEYFGFATVADRAPVSHGDLEEGLRWATERGLRSSFQGDTLVAEFPWDRDELSEGGGQTSLLTVHPTERHPLFGNGVLALLQLPLSVSGEKLDSLVDRLNNWELEELDLPPSIGSWVASSCNTAGWICFVPNFFCYSLLPRQLVVWSSVRAFGVRRLLAGVDEPAR